jgi:tRNA1Val (adenine37-N6)-methyltransferase
MPNPYFRFKQFIIHQDRCVMKVCTDSCILGAWTALELNQVKSILDIGTGSGLLALMLAQKSDAAIDAIESDPDAAGQAIENIQLTPWSNRIRIIEGDVRDHQAPGGYDFIITNPPFYESDLHSPENKKNRAKHDVSLTLDQLLAAINKNLKPYGAFSILLPYHRHDYFQSLARGAGFFLLRKLNVLQTPAHAPFRSICLFSYREPSAVASEILIIKKADGNYSERLIEIMKDYYLDLEPNVH